MKTLWLKFVLWRADYCTEHLTKKFEFYGWFGVYRACLECMNRREHKRRARLEAATEKLEFLRKS